MISKLLLLASAFSLSACSFSGERKKVTVGPVVTETSKFDFSLKTDSLAPLLLL